MLQRSANPRNDMMDVSDGSRTPTPKETTPRPETIVKTDLSSNIDPALGGAGVTSPALSSAGEHSENGDSARDRAEEAWIANIRVVEALRKLISDRLERKDYDDDEDVSMSGTEHKQEKSSESLYPVLRADDD
jgi:hypothetical protein